MTRLLSLAALLLAGGAAAEPVGITAEMMTATVETPDGPVEIGRVQDNDNLLAEEWALTSRACPPFCIQPMEVAPGVSTIGELELIAALQDPDVIVIDSRTPDWFEGGTIPGAVNMGWDRMTDHLQDLGCEPDFEGYDCSEAAEVVLFCNGMWCGQSPTAIRVMLAEGYPAEKISWYRGGMQDWRVLGLTVTGD